jgi:hypothetical protein
MGTAGVPSAPAATEAGTWTNPLFAQDAEAQGSSGHDVDIFSSARSSRVYKIKSLGDIVRKLGKVCGPLVDVSSSAHVSIPEGPFRFSVEILKSFLTHVGLRLL